MSRVSRQFYSGLLFMALLFLAGCENRSLKSAQNSVNLKQNLQNKPVKFHLIGDQ